MCRACEEAKRAAIAFYDLMAKKIRQQQKLVRPIKPYPSKYHDRPWTGVPKEEAKP